MVGPDDKSGCRHGISFAEHLQTSPGIVSQIQFEILLREYVL
jgi:hypothetical protein